jgi:hypothetical protein
MKKMKRFAGPEGSMIEGDASVSEQMEQMPAKAAPTPSKNRVVTKEELAASGLSLRDFLNKERGLTRRGESAPAKPAVKTEKAPAKPTSKAEESKRGIGPYNVFSGPSEADPEAVKAAKAAGDERRAKQAAAPMLNNPFRGAIDALRERGKKSNPDAYAKGGNVSKASSRADGIAQRGKTRGKMC